MDLPVSEAFKPIAWRDALNPPTMVRKKIMHPQIFLVSLRHLQKSSEFSLQKSQHNLNYPSFITAMYNIQANRTHRFAEGEINGGSQVRSGSMCQSSMSLHILSAGTPGASVWPSPRQMPGPSQSP